MQNVEGTASAVGPQSRGYGEQGQGHCDGVPEVLWLQWYGDGDPDMAEIYRQGADDSDGAPWGVTWCTGEVFEGDIRYVRADTVEPPMARATVALAQAWEYIDTDRPKCATERERVLDVIDAALSGMAPWAAHAAATGQRSQRA